jgi:4-amino-4-deoxychorismate lyase
MNVINGKFVNTITTNNRSFQFGDGIFETCKVVGGKILLWDCHLERLQKGLKVLQINLNLDDLLGDLALVLPQIQNGGLKIIISRGESLQGYGYDNLKPDRIIYSFDLPTDKNNIDLNFCTSGYYANPNLAGIKHQNRLEQILARGKNADCIMLDEKDNVISTTAANIFMVQNNSIYTPNLDNCGILGTRRQYLIDNLDIKVKNISKKELLNADEVFITNAVFGILSVSSIADIKFTNTLTTKIKNQLNI